MDVIDALQQGVYRRENGMYTCNSCKTTNGVWHCTICDDFDLCQSCYEKSKHEHKMEQIKSISSDVDSNSGEPAAMSTDSKSESIQRCIQSLVHASQCRDVNCQRLCCRKMKRVVQHTIVCKKRQVGHCPVCKQLAALCCFHARTCSEHKCLVPFCHQIRKNLNNQRLEMEKKIQCQSSFAANGPLMRDYHQANAGQGSLSVAAPSVIPTTVQGRMKVNAATQAYTEEGNVQISGQMAETGMNARTDFSVMLPWTVEARRRSSFLNHVSSQHDPVASSQSGGVGMINAIKKENRSVKE
ncbi:Protein cbp-1 [Trichinella zimbabwensis]|uniref:histone acetyltransferase n=2 Tax=Trichinella zimbabwensis TaxID=268475 RepID=A0A0V1I1Y2_9BILA|nr:Protein cbp-1 [Trichinella zimbabwensis]